MTPLSDSDNQLATALQLALERDELSLCYQPKISLADGQVAGVEALMRWESAALGSIDPTTFIPVAERAGMIDVLTDWLLNRALGDWKRWHDQGIDTGLAVNVSATTLRNLDFPDYLQRLCHLEGVPTARITVELTEGATQHVVRLLDTLTRFRIKGIGVALDDFGTGYSSLLQLRQLPFTELKIDRHFIEDVAQAEDSRLIVESMIGLAHALGLQAVAEGVESEETLRLLAEMGCDQAQGFFIATPLTPAELVPWMLKSGPRLKALCGGTNEEAAES